MSKSVKALLEQLARLSIDSRTAVSIWALTEDSPKAVEMTTRLLREMDSATKHDALEAMTKAIVKHPTPDMIRLRMPEEKAAPRAARKNPRPGKPTANQSR